MDDTKGFARQLWLFSVTVVYLTMMIILLTKQVESVWIMHEGFYLSKGTLIGDLFIQICKA